MLPPRELFRQKCEATFPLKVGDWSRRAWGLGGSEAVGLATLPGQAMDVTWTLSCLKAAVPAIPTSGRWHSWLGHNSLLSEQEVTWWQTWTLCCFVTLTQRPDVPRYTLSPLPGEEYAEGLHGTVAGL